MQALKFTFILLEVILLFNLLIFVHELGHFLAARWRGLHVDRFAIWFGKPIWKRKIRGVEYALGWIPAGGYVALPQMAPMETIEGKSEDRPAQLPAITAMDKIIVAFAGPLFSFLLAVAFAVIVWGVGKPVKESDQTRTIGWVDIGGPAWKGGLRPGDEVLEIDGHPIKQFGASSHESVVWRIVTSEGTNIHIKYLRAGQELTATVTPYRRPTKWYERKALRQVLIAPAHDVVVHDVFTNSPAAAAGLKRGDQVLSINGEKIYSVHAVLKAQEDATNPAAGPVRFGVQRGDQKIEVSMRAEKPVSPADSLPSFGLIPSWEGRATNALAYPHPWDQITASVSQIVGTLSALFSPKSDIGPQQLGGAVMIIRVYTNLFDSPDGWRLVLWFSVVMNVNLALLNLLPFPVLDGGHITLALLEQIRRKPVSGAILNYFQTACAMLLIGFMIFIAFFDTGDWLRSARQGREEPVVFAPKK